METMKCRTFEMLRRCWEAGDKEFEAMTSGSTGKPRLIMLPRQLMESSASRTIAFFRLDRTSHLHSCVGPQFIGGKMMLVRSLMSGAEFTYEPPTNRVLTDVDPDYAIDLLAVVPSQMLSLLGNHGPLPEIRNIIIGGSAIDPTLRTRIAHSNLNAYETYGMTETASHIALRHVNADPEPFTPLPGVELSTDERGCLVISLAGLETPLITNDLVTLHNNGTFEITGRIDDVIITGGMKVNPLEAEAILAPAFGGTVAVTSVPDIKWGSKVVAVADCEPDNNDIFTSILASMPVHMRPKALAIVGSLPATANGKLRRPELPDVFIFAPRIIFLQR